MCNEEGNIVQRVAVQKDDHSWHNQALEVKQDLAIALSCYSFNEYLFRLNFPSDCAAIQAMVKGWLDDV